MRVFNAFKFPTARGNFVKLLLPSNREIILFGELDVLVTEVAAVSSYVVNLKPSRPGRECVK